MLVTDYMKPPPECVEEERVTFQQFVISLILTVVTLLLICVFLFQSTLKNFIRPTSAEDVTEDAFWQHLPSGSPQRDVTHKTTTNITPVAHSPGVADVALNVPR
ncbi:hypothetical protein V5799_029460 [Amblyomma americanum]|uniref:Uncharacterized protein n=1 Tax=Amblyomma americanum TaxID=6943 RepID=A0AAQ4ER96_AMBAM